MLNTLGRFADNDYTAYVAECKSREDDGDTSRPALTTPQYDEALEHVLAKHKTWDFLRVRPIADFLLAFNVAGGDLIVDNNPFFNDRFWNKYKGQGLGVSTNTIESI